MADVVGVAEELGLLTEAAYTTGAAAVYALSDNDPDAALELMSRANSFFRNVGDTIPSSTGEYELRHERRLALGELRRR